MRAVILLTAITAAVMARALPDMVAVASHMQAGARALGAAGGSATSSA